MSVHPTVYVRCRFTRGGFGSERVFWIPTPEGDGEYRGLAYVGYCFRTDFSRLTENDSVSEQSVDGLVTARIIREESDRLVTVQVPDGELCRIAPSIISEPKNVLVGS